jgi:hypothetical protein
MRFKREIPLTDDKLNELIALHNFGFVLVYKEDSVEIWADVYTDELKKAA